MTPSLRVFSQDWEQLVQKNGGRPAIVDGHHDKVLTYSELDAHLRRIGRFLAGTPSDQVIYCFLPNSVEKLVVFLAAMLHGRVYAPLAPDASDREVAGLVETAGPGICLVPETPTPRNAVLSELGISPVSISLDGFFSWAVEPAGATFSGGRGRLLITTSGTTAAPKIMAFDADVLWSSGCAFAGVHPFLDADTRFLNILPMSYLGGLFNLGLIPLCVGGSTVVVESFSGKTFLDFWQMVERFDINTLWLVPTLIKGLLTIAKRTQREKIAQLTTKIRAGFLGTAPIDLASKTLFEETFHFPLLENLALSETTFFTCESVESRAHRVQSSVGERLPYVDIELRKRMEPDEEGASSEALPEIWVRTPYLFSGYLEKGGVLRLPVDKDGFFPTADLGRYSHGETLVLGGRSRDIIKRGGIFVSLREIELVAETHPAVVEAAAVGIPHEFYGEDSVLFVKLRIPSSASVEDDLLKWIHQNLTRSKWPARLRVIDELPRTRSGKILKRELPTG